VKYTKAPKEIHITPKEQNCKSKPRNTLALPLDNQDFGRLSLCTNLMVEQNISSPTFVSSGNPISFTK